MNKTKDMTIDEILELSKVKEEFLNNITHEIRTPMNSILGFSTILNGTDLNKQQQRYVDYILAGSQLLLSLINNVLDFSKLKSGKFSLEIIDVDLQKLLDFVENTLSENMNNNKIIFKISKNIPKIIKTDEVKLKQILINLISNSLKFTKNGKITCNITKTKNSYLKFKIKDTGIGIPEEKIKTIFCQFNQGDNSTTRKYGGTGLGLSICKKLVESFEGEITVKSKRYKGTTFNFLIPIIKART